MSFSVNGLKNFPDITEIKKRSQGLALVDAILMPEWEYRYFSFNRHWGEAGEMMASMRDGSGSEYFILFNETGVIGKVFYQAIYKDKQLLEKIPQCFNSFREEVAFSLEYTSYVFWKRNNDDEYVILPSNLTNFPLLTFLEKGIDFYHPWAESYYERKIDKNTLSSVFNTLKVTNNDIRILNNELTLANLEEDIVEILGNRE